MWHEIAFHRASQLKFKQFLQCLQILFVAMPLFGRSHTYFKPMVYDVFAWKQTVLYKNCIKVRWWWGVLWPNDKVVLRRRWMVFYCNEAKEALYLPFSSLLFPFSAATAPLCGFFAFSPNTPTCLSHFRSPSNAFFHKPFPFTIQPPCRCPAVVASFYGAFAFTLIRCLLFISYPGNGLSGPLTWTQLAGTKSNALYH